MKKNSIPLTCIFLLFLQLPVFAQEAKKNESAPPKNNWLDFVTIKIDRYKEVLIKSEVDVIYLKNKEFKIHAVVNLYNEPEKKLDTVFTLNTAQLAVVEDFFNHFQKNDFPLPKDIMEGSKEFFSCTLDGDTITLWNKSEYSLIELIINN
jgi:mevalonate pyrophosphate decarboxylase